MITLYRRGQLKAEFDRCRADMEDAAIALERAAVALWGTPALNPQADPVRAIASAAIKLHRRLYWDDVRPLSAPPTPPPSNPVSPEQGKFLWD